MRVSLDLDGTVWKYRKEFAWLFKIFKASGHEVGILTAHTDHIKDADLHLLQARCQIIPDFFICKDDNTFTDASESTGLWKARMVLEHDIHLHFDDFDIHKPERHEKYLKSFERGIAEYPNYMDQPKFVVVK